MVGEARDFGKRRLVLARTIVFVALHRVALIEFQRNGHDGLPTLQRGTLPLESGCGCDHICSENHYNRDQMRTGKESALFYSVSIVRMPDAPLESFYPILWRPSGCPFPGRLLSLPPSDRGVAGMTMSGPLGPVSGDGCVISDFAFGVRRWLYPSPATPLRVPPQNSRTRFRS